MTFKRNVQLVSAVVFASALICLSPALSIAQFGVRVPIKSAARNPTPTVRRTVVRRRPVIIQKVNNVVRTKVERVRVSNLSVITEPGAKVMLASLARAGKLVRPIVADSKGNAIFEELAPGNYSISASKAGFDTQEQDLVKIAPQKPHVLDLALVPITYKLKIETNLSDGEVRYAQAVKKGVDAKGSIISDEIGNYCIVKIERNGQAVIPDLKDGYYNLDIRPSALEYDPVLVGVDVPEDTEQEDDKASGETKTFEIVLEKKISRETFGSAWTKDEWTMPANWSLDRGMKVRDSIGVALPRNEQYRYYTNFEMISDVKLNDGGTVGFALRAVDIQNYYLVQISGARAAEPNVAKAYVVRNGESQQIFSVSTTPFASAIASKNGFRVMIKGDDKGFRVSIDDSDTGIREAVGIIIDRDNTFRKGAVGIASRGRSNFEVKYFQVCPSSCR
ncbi:MAG: carboxypeptidase-like regulatory domain-containing protein [Pyrinomonadaceae bacterium]